MLRARSFVYTGKYLLHNMLFMYYVQWGQSPLWSASFNDRLKCVQLLIDAGAQVDVQDEVSVSSCMHVCTFQRLVSHPPHHDVVSW